MRLPAAGVTDCRCRHGAAGGRAVRSGIAAGIGRPIAVDGTRAIGRSIGTDRGMVMSRQLSGSQSDRLAAAWLADHSGTQTGSATLMQRNTAGEIRQSECRRAVAAVGGSNERKQCFIFCD